MGTLPFPLQVLTWEGTAVPVDTLQVQAVSGGVMTTLATYSNGDKSTGYVRRSLDVSAFSGRQTAYRFVSNGNTSLPTSFVLDGVALRVS